ncbi:lysosomal amino acid transporter 1 homolog [Alosa alosa]|nr:lysosomal amino acid transporter 1 homolog [Alosa alosa]
MAHVRYPEKTSVDVAGNVSVVLGRPICVNGTPWILFLFEECVENIWEYWSVVIGLISMLCFLLSTLPQVYEAYKSGKVDEAMSVGFILFLLLGDLGNLAGCYLTRQLPIQIVTAVFYIYTDSILISQFLYYKIKNNSARRNPLLKWICLIWFGLGTAICVVLPKLIEAASSIPNIQLQGKSSSLMTSGYACGYLSSICYLSSRFPQLYINFKRQSTEGTSYLLFFLAMLGNGTYGLSLMVMLPALKSSRVTFILNHLAWLIGSLGVLFLDFFVTAQFIMYRKKGSSEAVQELKIAEEEPLLFEEDEF